ncbi:MAG TPA: penicillin-binding transpeptidase domain-containing protein [Ktedonobacterales bacterium]
MSGASGGGDLPPLDQTPGQPASTPAGQPPAQPATPPEAAPKERPPVLRYVPTNPPPVSTPPSDEITQDMPPEGALPDIFGARSVEMSPQARRLSIIATTIVVLVSLVLGAIYLPWRDWLKGSSLPIVGGCAAGSACAAGNDYLDAYSSGDYEAMYNLTSAASHQRFSSSQILGANFKDAHDYIVNRTKSILDESQVTTIRVTTDNVKQTNDTTATLPAHIILTSQRVGDIPQDINIPLVNEKGKWLVNWSPGLIYSQLDDDSDPNYTRKVHLFSAIGKRGSILDRDGNALAKDDTVYDVGVVRGKITNESALLNALASKLDFTTDQVKAKYQNAGANDFTLIRSITPMLYGQVSNAIANIAGVEIHQRIARVYPYGADAAAATGYVQAVSPDDLKNDKSGYYDQSDVIGRAGVELWAEQQLRPVKGGSLQIDEQNADGSLGKVVATLGSRDAANGADVHTSLSIADQQAAMSGLRGSGFSGGAMAVDPATGEVFAIASFPIYDPNDLALGFTPNGLARFQKLNAPYNNRALQSAQPVGSVFKIITLSSGLEHGIKPTDVFTDNGSVSVPGTNYTLHEAQVSCHGDITPVAAIGPSCDVTPAQIALKLNGQDPNILPTTAKAFGFGSPTGILGFVSSEENAGLVPDPQYYKDKKHADWTGINAVNLSIGQDDFGATPAQIAMAAQALANGGVRMQPRLVTQITSPDGAIIASYAPKPVGKLPLSADNLSAVQIAMLGPTTQPNGTAYFRFKDFPLQIAGKTGTAESGQPRPDGWFMSFAPAITLSANSPKPQIAMGSLVEYSDFGECYAAPTTALTYVAHLKGQYNLNGNYYATHIGCSTRQG